MILDFKRLDREMDDKFEGNNNEQKLIKNFWIVKASPVKASSELAREDPQRLR